MHVFEVAREDWTAFWDRGGPSALFAPRGWTEMAALRTALSIFSLRLRPPRRCDFSSRHAPPLLVTLELAGSTRLLFLYCARVADRRGEKIRLQNRHIRKFLQESLGWTEFNTFLVPSFVPLHFFLTAFLFPHNSPNSTTPFFSS